MKDFIFSILKEIVVKLLVKFILFENKKKWLEERPDVKYKIDLSLYCFHKYIYCTFFSIVFTIYGISISLFDPNYNALPRFTAAWIIFVTGLSITILFKHINRDFHRPIRPF
jgi:hypothetical protein